MTLPADVLSAAVTILAVLFIFYTGINVARMRGKHKVDAPATTGPQEFECAYRVQVNTVEQAILFFPLLWVATGFFHGIGWLPALFGLIWVIGRFLYLQGYMAAPNKRSTGFMITILATAGLLILSLIGVVQSWMAVTAA
jgi:glutathione S-transferase